MPKWTIGLKFSLFVLVLTAMTGASLIYVGTRCVQKEALKAAKYNMASQIRYRSAGLIHFLNVVEDRFELIGTRTRLRELLDERLDGHISQDRFINRTRKILEDARSPKAYKGLRKTESIFSIEEIGIYGPNGNVITTTALTPRKSQDEILEIIEVSDIMVRDKKYFATVKGQILTPKNRKLGLFLIADITRLITDFLNKESLGETGAIALVSFKGHHLTPLIMSEDIGLENIEDFLNSEKLNNFDSPTFFGNAKSVHGNLNSIFSLNYQDWFVTIKKDISEVLLPIEDLQKNYLQAVVPILFVALFLSAVFAWYFTSPIKALTQATTHLIDGKKHIELPVDRNDEIGILSKRFREMSDTVAENEQELMRLYKETLKASQLKDEFLATVTHELRNPASIIIGYADLLASREFLDEESKKHIEIISKNARSEIKLIEDLLETSKLFTGRLKIVPASILIGDVVNEVVENIKLAIKAKGIELNIEKCVGEPYILGDKSRLIQVVWNLLINAIRHTDRGGKINIYIEQSGKNVRLTIEDTGEGIDPAFLPFVFERFRQDDSRQRLDGEGMGMGIGLALVKGIVEAHGGQVTAQSPGRGQGSKFTISIPMIDAENTPS